MTKKGMHVIFKNHKLFPTYFQKKMIAAGQNMVQFKKPIDNDKIYTKWNNTSS